MKKILFTLTLVLTIGVLKAQEPLPVELCYVTVSSDSLAELYWTHPDTTTINGFIIKRIIYDGQDVVSGTLNNIEVINNNTILTYTDTSTSYSTTALPYSRPEEYSINAFLIRNDSIILSNMTLTQKTIYLTTEWDYCNQIANINWTEYINRNVIKYQLYYGTNKDSLTLLKEFSNAETSYTTETLNKNTNYFFVVKAVLDAEGNCSQDTSLSNFSRMFTSYFTVPKTLTNVKISAIDNHKLEIKYIVSKTESIKQYELNRNDAIVQTFDISDTVLYYVDNADASQLNYYYITGDDLCDRELVKTDLHCNFVLTVVKSDKEFSLNWTDALIYESTPNSQTIQFKVDDGIWTDLKQSSSNNNEEVTFSEVLEDYAGTIPQYIFFRIKAEKDYEESYSNSVEVSIPTILAIPNAFNPYSSNEENSFFTIKAEFLQEFSIIIFDDSGNIIYKTEDINSPWNGKYKSGTVVERGTYIYSINYTNNAGEKNKISGVINVVY